MEGESEGDREYLCKRGTIRAGQAMTQVKNNKRRENHNGGLEGEHGRRVPKKEGAKQRIVTRSHHHSGDNARHVSVFFSPCSAVMRGVPRSHLMSSERLAGGGGVGWMDGWREGGFKKECDYTITPPPFPSSPASALKY